MSSSPYMVAGRFVVCIGDEAWNGLAAHEVAEQVERAAGADVQIFVIHRVTAEGEMEMAGVAPARLWERDCLVLAYDAVRTARADYDAIETAAGIEAPPCRVQLALARVDDAHQGHRVVLTFPRPCADAVRGWLGRVAGLAAAPSAAGAAAMDAFGAVVRQIVRQTELETVCRS